MQVSQVALTLKSVQRRCNFSEFERGRTDKGETTSASCGTTPVPRIVRSLACFDT